MRYGWFTDLLFFMLLCGLWVLLFSCLLDLIGLLCLLCGLLCFNLLVLLVTCSICCDFAGVCWCGATLFVFCVFVLAVVLACLLWALYWIAFVLLVSLICLVGCGCFRFGVDLFFL